VFYKKDEESSRRTLHRCVTDFVFRVFNYFKCKEQDGGH